MRIAEVTDWLVAESHAVPTAEALIHAIAARLGDLDLVRVNLQLRPLSPQVVACNYMWRPAASIDEVETTLILSRDVARFETGIVTTTALAFGAFETDAYRRSPFHRVVELGEPEARFRIGRDQTSFAHPLLADLQAQGATDYVALPFRMRGMRASAISFATRRAGGFTDAELAALARLVPGFQLAMSPFAAAYTMRAVVSAYLGDKTAERVLSGQIVRGDVEEIDAAIWFSDLRGFTPMSAGVGSRELIGWLNDYFDAIARAIARHDGEILKFIGDAVLAVWPGAPASTCPAALAAARDADAELAALNTARAARGLAPMQHGIGLHVGAVQYGNIGAQGRLDFTVIGSAVNVASRLEGACARLGRRIVASADFAARAPGLAPLGAIELKGIAAPVDIYGE